MLKIILVCLLLSGCASPRIFEKPYYIGGSEANVAFVRKQIDHDEYGRTVARVMLWCDGEWYQVGQVWK